MLKAKADFNKELTDIQYALMPFMMMIFDFFK